MYVSGVKLSKEFVTRPYQNGDEESIVELLSLAFPEWANRKNSLDYWNWKYRDTPLGSSIIVAVSGGKIIGVGHDIRLNIKVGSTVLSSQYGDDFATHPDYRGIGVYNKILKIVQEIQEKEVKFDYWLSNNPIIINNARKNLVEPGRFQFPYKLIHMFRVRDMALHVKKKSVKNPTLVHQGFSVVKTLNKAKNVLPAKKHLNAEDFRIVKTLSFDDHADALWEKVKDNYNFIIEKEQSYLNWRYCDPRGGIYLIKEAKIGNETLGFVVLEVRGEADYPEGYIVDLLTMPKRLDIAYTLLKNSCEYFDSLGLNAVHFQIVEGHPFQGLASKTGFVELPGTSKLYIGCSIADGCGRDQRILEFSSPNRLYFNYGDYY